MQIGPNFPAKSLRIYTKNFSYHIFNLFNWNKVIKENLRWKLWWFIEYKLQDNKSWNKNWSLYFIDLLSMVIIQEDKEIKIYFISNVDYLLKVKLGYLFKKKKIGACVFWAPYFSSHSAGNLPHLHKCYGINKENIDACVSFLAGKFSTTNSP